MTRALPLRLHARPHAHLSTRTLLPPPLAPMSRRGGTTSSWGQLGLIKRNSSPKVADP